MDSCFEMIDYGSIVVSLVTRIMLTVLIMRILVFFYNSSVEILRLLWLPIMYSTYSAVGFKILILFELCNDTITTFHLILHQSFLDSDYAFSFFIYHPLLFILKHKINFKWISMCCWFNNFLSFVITNFIFISDPQSFWVSVLYVIGRVL